MPVTTILSLLSALTIVAGAIFAVFQLRPLSSERAREPALQMPYAFQTPDFLVASVRPCGNV